MDRCEAHTNVGQYVATVVETGLAVRRRYSESINTEEVQKGEFHGVCGTRSVRNRPRL